MSGLAFAGELATAWGRGFSGATVLMAANLAPGLSMMT